MEKRRRRPSNRGASDRVNRQKCESDEDERVLNNWAAIRLASLIRASNATLGVQKSFER